MRPMWKKISIFILTISLALILTPIEGVEAGQIKTSPFPEMIVSPVETKKYDLTKPFIHSLQRLNYVNQYEVRMKWTNIDTNQQMGQVKLLGDNKAGNLKGQITFFQPNYYPQSTHLDFISYGRYRLFYVKEFELLNSLAYYKQPFFERDFSRVVEFYNDYYTELSGSSLEISNPASKQSQSQLLLPNEEKLAELQPEQLTYGDQKYHLYAERLGIPSQLFQDLPQFNITYNLNHLIQRSSNTQVNYAAWDNRFDHSLKVDEDARAFSAKLSLNSDFISELLGNEEGRKPSQVPQFSTDLQLSSRGLIDKLTKVELTYSPRNKDLTVLMEGMVENVDFNFFTNETAQLSTHHVRLEYNFHPTSEKIPSLNELSTLSVGEANYLLEQLLD